MYRLMLYTLIVLVGAAIVLSFFGLIGYTPWSIATAAIYLVLVCLGANYLLAKIFDVGVNVESAYITALILTLILAPVRGFDDIMVLAWAGIWSMASKYLFTIGRKHLFNPVAVGAWITGIGLAQYATWWVGTAWLTPLVLVGGLLITRKIRRFDLVLTFLAVAFVGTLVSASIFGHSSLEKVAQEFLLSTPLFFLAFVILTEPLTTPPDRVQRMIYGGLVGLLFTPQIHLAALYSTPEAALLIGNIYSFLVSPKDKLILRLKEKIKISPTVYDFVFRPEKKVNYRPGQFMEWTMPHGQVDSRGNRRFFTLASSPTEPTLRIGVKMSDHPSSFKKTLFGGSGDKVIVASQLGGEFTLPKDKSAKLVFIAGGIGVTPFRSMVKYLLDKNEKREITLFYAAKTSSELVYRDVFDEARKIGLKSIYVVKINDAKLDDVKEGQISQELITTEVPDYKNSQFYISGPHGMVEAFRKTLHDLGARSVKKDYFPGYV